MFCRNSFAVVFKKEILQASSFYKEYYLEKGVYECEIYDGMVGILCYLKSINKKIILATSKGEREVIDTIKYYGLENFFNYIAGADDMLNSVSEFQSYF